MRLYRGVRPPPVRQCPVRPVLVRRIRETPLDVSGVRVGVPIFGGAITSGRVRVPEIAGFRGVSITLRAISAPRGGWARYLEDGYRAGLGEWRVRYRRYLRSRAWEQRRDGALRRAGRRCGVCGSGDGLSVHHVTYDRVGLERVSDLRVLCRGCHEAAHVWRQPIPFDPVTRRRLELRATGSLVSPRRVTRRRPGGAIQRGEQGTR